MMEYYRFTLICTLYVLLVLPLDGGIILHNDRKTITGDVSLELPREYADLESPTELSRQRRSTNDTSGNSGTGNTGSGKSAIEEFYADRHNMAMFLILPLIILVYGGCACIYCVYKLRRYLRKRIVVYKKEKRLKILKRQSFEENSSFNKTGWSATTNEVHFVKSMPNLREIKTDVCERPSTALAACASIETQEVDQLLEELAIITEDKPVTKVTKTKKPTAEVTPVVQVRPTPVQRVQSNIIDKPKISKSPPIVVEVKSIADDDKNNNNDDSSASSGKSKKKNLILSASDIAEIMQYYNNKKHMPNVIPEESENDKEISKKHEKRKFSQRRTHV